MNEQAVFQPARLLILVSSDRRRGAEVFGEALGEGLRQRGWDVDLVALSTVGDGPRVAATPLASVSPDELGKLDLRVVRALRSRVAAGAPDIVLANGAATMQYAVAALRVMRRRPRLVYSSIGEPLYWIRSTRHRLLRAGILKGVDRVLSVSATTARQLVDHLGVAPGKVRVAPTGVPERFFAVVSEPPADHLHIVFIGNLSSEKDPLAALEIVARLADTTPVRMRYLGDGPLRADLVQAIAARGLGGVVEVLGSVPDVIPHLAWADVLLLTSRTEGLPGVPLEAGAAGVPTVAYGVGGTAETVSDGRTGRVIQPGDLEGAVGALVELAQRPDVRAAWGEAAKQMVASHFTLEASLDRYIDLLTDELRHRPAHAGGKGR